MLRPAGWLYGKIADIRNSLYDRGTLESHGLGSRTISIGNMTTGGTGKTPLVAHIARILADAGEKVCILTRGYGRDNPRSRVLVSDAESVLVGAMIGGDEPVELAHKLLGKAVVVADADRLSAGAWAKKQFGITTFVLDDAFQHRRVKRDLDIVCVDATNPCGGARMLPSGRLREPVHNLSRADAIVITRTNLVDSTETLVDRLRSYNPDCPIFGAEFPLVEVTKLQNFLNGVETGDDDDDDRQFVADAFAFCAIGNPEAFRAQLSDQHFSVSGVMPFADHYRYRQVDIVRIEDAAKARGSRGLITTAKDAIKLRDLELTLPCFVAMIEVTINDPSAFRELVILA